MDMQILMEKQAVPIDFSVFEITFDPHRRAYQCQRLIKLILRNEPDSLRLITRFHKKPQKAQVLCFANQQALLGYAAHLVGRIRDKEISFSAMEKYLSEAWGLCLTLGDKDVHELMQPDLMLWWESQKERYRNNELSWETLRKYSFCIINFFQFLEGLPLKKVPERLAWLELPKKPKRKLEDPLPSQVDVKKLLGDVEQIGRKFSIRDKAILSLLNDTGMRIGEALAIRNKNIREENDYLVIQIPESKSMPRIVISFLAKKDLEEWTKLTPSKSNPDGYFFCQTDGSPCRYPSIVKSFKRALAKSGITWRAGKSVHLFRAICASRFFEWPYALKNAWFGWAFRSHEGSYTKIEYKQFVNYYFETLKKEQNPLLKDVPFWSQEKLDEVIIEKLLEKDEFRAMLCRMVRQIGGKF